AIGAMEPFAGWRIELPSGVTQPSGGGPSHGPRTRTLWPFDRIARPRPSACSCTPPGTVRLYGDTMPMRMPTSGSVAGVVTSVVDSGRFGEGVARPVRLEEVPLL